MTTYLPGTPYYSPQPSSQLRERLLSSCPPQEAPFLSVLLSCLSRGCYLPVLSSQHKRGVVALGNDKGFLEKVGSSAIEIPLTIHM